MLIPFGHLGWVWRKVVSPPQRVTETSCVSRRCFLRESRKIRTMLCFVTQPNQQNQGGASASNGFTTSSFDAFSQQHLIGDQQARSMVGGAVQQQLEPATAAAAVDVAPAASESEGGYCRASEDAWESGSSSSSSGGDGGRWTTPVTAASASPPQTPPLDPWPNDKGSSSSSSEQVAQDPQQQRLPQHVLLALPFLFVPYLSSRDCLALAAAGKVRPGIASWFACGRKTGNNQQK